MLFWRAPLVAGFRSSVIRQKCDVVPGDKSVVILRSGQTHNVAGMLSNEFGSVGTRVVRYASSDLLAIRADNGDHVAVFEFIFNAGYASVQEACVLLRDRVHGP